MDEAIIGIIGALAGGAITAMVNSWLAARARIAEELREQRLQPYREIWVQTAMFSRWPWTDATYGHVRRFHDDLRQWYYADGGMLMSGTRAPATATSRRSPKRSSSSSGRMAMCSPGTSTTSR